MAPDAPFLMSDLERAEGNLNDALQETYKAIALDPKRPQFYVQLAGLQEAIAKTNEAETSLKKALEIDPKYVPAIEGLADLYEDLGQWLEAEKQLLFAIKLEPNKVEGRNRLARLYFSQGRKSEAEELMIQAKRDLALSGDLYRVLGDYYNDTGQDEKALEEFASISKDHPEDRKTKEDYIRLLLSHHNLQEATELDSEILKQNPGDPEAEVIRGTILNAQGKFKEAATILEDALKKTPEKAYGHYQLGLAFEKTGNTERAEQEWFEAEKLAPKMREVQISLAEVAREKGDRSLFRDTAEQLVLSNPSDPQGFMLRAESEIDSSQTAKAEGDLTQAIELAPQSAMGYAAMGNLMRKEGKNDAARTFYEKAIDRDPNDLEPLVGIVNLLVQERQIGLAVHRVQDQIGKAPNNDSLYALLGGLQVSNKDMVGAEVSLQKAVQINPKNLDAEILLSKIEMARGEPDASMATAYRSIAVNPTNPNAYFFAGTMEELRGQIQKAEEQYRKALKIEPNFAPAANNLAFVMLKNGENTDEALSLARIARQKMPDSASAADTLAWAYYQKRIYNLAAGLLQEALKKEPENATYHYHLGMVYEKQNNPAAARRHLQRALQINPNLPDASQIRKTLDQTG